MQNLPNRGLKLRRQKEHRGENLRRNHRSPPTQQNPMATATPPNYTELFTINQMFETTPFEKKNVEEQNYYLLLEGRALLLAPSPFCFPILVYWTRYSKRRSIKNIDGASCRAREKERVYFLLSPENNSSRGTRGFIRQIRPPQ